MSNKTLDRLYADTTSKLRLYHIAMIAARDPALTEDQREAAMAAAIRALEEYQSAESTYLMARDYLARKRLLA